MKQPDLGKKLTELRKAKGLTQEEVVERCNISVRTIQRIENGEVEPRSFTIRTILSALGYEFEDVFSQEQAETEQNSREENRSSHKEVTVTKDVTNQLNGALLFGIVYLLLTFPEAYAEYKKFDDGTTVFGSMWYTVLKVGLLISSIIFQWGIFTTGKLFDNYLLCVSALLNMAFVTGLTIYDITSISSETNYFAMIPIAMLFGAITLLAGVGFVRLQKNVGRTAMIAGGLEILSACMFLTVVLFPFADLVKMFAELVELVILYKVIDLVRARSVLTQ